MEMVVRVTGAMPQLPMVQTVSAAEFETAKRHGNKVNNCNSRIVSGGKNVFVKENNPEGRRGNKMKKDYI